MSKQKDILWRNIWLDIVKELGLKRPSREEFHSASIDDLFALTSNGFPPFHI